MGDIHLKLNIDKSRRKLSTQELNFRKHGLPPKTVITGNSGKEKIK
jgi:hypothetical protein